MRYRTSLPRAMRVAVTADAELGDEESHLI